MKKHFVPYRRSPKKHQKDGSADTNPFFDVNDVDDDTANKLAILAFLAWGSWVKVKNISVIKGIAGCEY
jgi:homoserine dehydrogenase